jgi:prepilin-type N-terminal cleavage/methylation domain-containing protein
MKKTIMTTSRTTSCGTAPGGAGPAGRGFTLMEMVVVIGLVALMASLALPSIMALYNSGADSQAYNLIAAQLTAARALAIEKATYAGVHVQLADAGKTLGSKELLRPDQENLCYSAIVLYNPRKRQFNIYSQPRQVPKPIAFGKLAEETVDAGGASYKGRAGTKEVFTTFTVVFSPRGSAVKSVNGQPVEFDYHDRVFSDEGVDPNDLLITGSQRLWHMDPNMTTSYCQKQYAVTALTLFDMGEYLGVQAGKRTKYLNENAQFLPLNVHTGQLLPRE